jgi:adenine-specific DNA-methyltransferase
VIFISIDDNEQANLKRLCDEVFGEDNHIATIANVNNPKGRSDDRFIATAHESLVFFAKNKQDAVVYGFELEENITRRYNKNDEFGDYREIDLRKTGDNDKREDRPNLFYYFYFNQITGELYPSREEQKIDGFIQIKPLKDTGEDGNWRWGFDNSQNNTLKLIARYMPNRKIWGVFEKDYLEGRSLAKPTSAWTFKEVNSERGSEAFIQLNFDKKVFPRPKPLGLIHRILNVSVSPKSENDIILDFFSGSATTAHAVMQLNAEDGGKRKFIMVQIPEACDEKSEAFKAGYKTIADIGKERIRRAGQKIKADNPLTAMDLDIGFRVLKVDSSNMNEVYYSPDTLNREDLHQFVENIRNDRSDEDLLFQVLLDWGVDLTLPITSQVIDGKTVFIVAQDAIVACFDRAGGVSETFIKELAAIKPLRAVFCDSGFANDSVKINVEQIFKMMSPSTDIKTI